VAAVQLHLASVRAALQTRARLTGDRERAQELELRPERDHVDAVGDEEVACSPGRRIGSAVLPHDPV